MQIEYSKGAVKYINKLDKPTKVSEAIREAVELLEVLPPKDQDFAIEFLKKMVLAWDSDYTKVTPAERKALDAAERDIAEHGTTPHDAINWD